MPSRLLRSPRLVTLLCAFALGAILGLFAWRRITQVFNRLDVVLVDTLKSQLGRDVRSGAVRVDRQGRFTILNLRIAEGKTFAEGTFAQADRVEGQLDLLTLLRNRAEPLKAVKSLRIVHPTVTLVRRPDGEWNFLDLLRPKGPKKPYVPFGGVATVTNGTLLLRDYRSYLAKSGAPVETRIARVNGTLDGRRAGPLQFQASGAGAQRIGPFNVSGEYDPPGQEGTVAASVNRLDLAYWVDYFTRRHPAWAVRAGLADAHGTVKIAHGKVDLPTLEASVLVKGGAATLAALRPPLRSVTLRATARGAAVRATATGLLENIPLTLNARIADLHQPIVDASATVGTFAVERLPRLLTALSPKSWPDLTGPVALTARATGPPNDLRLAARLRSTQLARQGMSAQGVDATVTLVKGLLKGNATVRQAFGAGLTAQGEMRLNAKGQPWSASGRVRGLDVKAVAPPSAQVAGTATGSFAARGSGGKVTGRANLAMAEGSAGPFRFRRGEATVTTADGRAWNARVTMATGNVQRFDFRSLAGDVTYRGGDVTVHSATADAWQGTLRASGMVAKSGALNLNLNANNVRLAELLAPLHQSGITGVGDFSGRLLGKASSPILQGRFTARNGVARGLPYDFLAGTVRATPSSLALQNGVLRSGRGAVALAGTVSFGKDGVGPLNLSGRFTNVPGSLLTRINAGPNLTLPPALASATLNGRWRASGVPSRLRLSFRDARIGLPTGSAAFNGTLDLRQGAPSADFTASLSRVPVALATGLKVNGKRLLPLDSVSPALQASTVSGVVKATGRPPNLTLAFNRVRLDLPEGSAALNGSLALGKSPNVSRLTVTLDHVPASVVNGLNLGGGPFALPSQIRGATISGTATLSGSPKDLQGTGRLVAGPITLQGEAGRPYTVQEARANFTLSGRQLFLQDVSLSGEGLTLTGGGQVSLAGGPMEVNLTGSQLPLEMLQPFIGQYAQLVGEGTATLVARGTLKRPDLRMQVDAGPLLVNDVRFDRLTGSARWDGRTVAVEGMTLSRGASSLSIANATLDPRAQTLDANLQASRIDVDPYFQVLENSPFLLTASGQSLRLLLTEFPVPRTGVLDGQITLNGPLDDLTVGVGVTGDALALGGTNLNRLVLDATWNRDFLRLPRLRVEAPDLHLNAFGEMAKGNALGITARLTDTRVDSILRLVKGVPSLRRSSIGQKLLQAVETLQAPVDGSLNARLSLTGTTEFPQGQFDFNADGMKIGPQQFEVARGSFAILRNRMQIQTLRLESGDALVTASGSGSFSGDLNFQLDINNFNVQLLAPWIGLPRTATGVLDVVSVSVTGTQANPILQASLNATNVGTAKFALDHIDAPDIHAGAGELRIGKLSLRERAPGTSGAELVTTISGSLPFGFRPLGFSNEGRLNLHADVQDMNLGILAAFTPEVKSADGVFGGQLDIGGTLAKPVASGNLALRDGQLQLARFENTFNALNARIDFNQTRITLTDARGTSSKGGGFTASGTASLERFPNGALQLSLKTTEDLGLQGNNVSTMLGERFNGFLSADVTLNGSLARPRAHGSLLAHDTTLNLPETPPAASGPVAAIPLPNVTFRDFTVTAGHNFSVRRGGFNGDITGALTVNGAFMDRQGANPFRVNGRFALDNARVRVATKTFTVQDGSSITVAYRPPDDPRIRVDIAASTRIYTYSGLDRTRQPYQVTVLLTGSLDNPTLDFESDPGDLSRNQILAALGYQSQIQALLRGGQEGDRALRQGLMEAFTGVVTPALFEPLELSVMRALNLEEFAVSFDFNSPLQVQVTKHLWSKFYFTYRRQFTSGGEGDYMMKLFYRITPRISVSASTDERHINTFLVEGRLRF